MPRPEPMNPEVKETRPCPDGCGANYDPIGDPQLTHHRMTNPVHRQWWSARVAELHDASMREAEEARLWQIEHFGTDGSEPPSQT